MTKLHEEFVRGSVEECLAVMRAREASESRIKGEFTVAVGPDGSAGKGLWPSFGGGDGGGGGSGGGGGGGADETTAQAVTRLLMELRADGISRSEAVKIITQMTGEPKSVVYAAALSIALW